jgi:hypothetical protein
MPDDPALIADCPNCRGLTERVARLERQLAEAGLYHLRLAKMGALCMDALRTRDDVEMGRLLAEVELLASEVKERADG